MLRKAKERAEEIEKEAKKARRKFVELLQKRTKEITENTTYDEAQSMLKKEAAWQGIEDDIRRQCFDIFRDQLAKMAEESRKEQEEEERRKEEKKKAKKKKKVREEEYDDEDDVPEVKEKKSKRSRRDEDDGEEPEKKKKKKKS